MQHKTDSKLSVLPTSDIDKNMGLLLDSEFSYITAVYYTQSCTIFWVVREPAENCN